MPPNERFSIRRFCNTSRKIARELEPKSRDRSNRHHETFSVEIKEIHPRVPPLILLNVV